MKKTEYKIQTKLYQGKKNTVYSIKNNIGTGSYILKKCLVDEGLIKEEYHLIQQINSDYVIKAIDFIKDGEEFGFFMEDISGIALADYLAEGNRLSLDQFFDLAISITKGLVAIHEKSIIHKDINPSNIIWNPTAQAVKIIDFDLSSKFELKISHLGNPEKLEGTLGYLSPEQTGRVNQTVDQRSDLYSLGITLYELITGKRPFEQTNSMELIYAHLAQYPTPVHLIDSKIPKIISDLISKLIQKDPADRYQSAVGVKHDLEKIQNILSGSKKLTTFNISLGEQDYFGKLRIPEKLYGRESEVEQLLDVYNKVVDGSKEIILVTGESGVGKTSLVNEIHKPLVKQSVFFIEGKFDQLQRNIPYFAFSQAFKKFCDLLLAEDQKTLNKWKSKILNQTEGMIKVLFDIIPNLQLITGDQPDVPVVEGNEAKVRLHYVMQRFVKAICEDSILAIFIDDLQWADNASLELINILMTDALLHNLMFIGAYRNNEVSVSHPFIIFLEDLKQKGITVSEIVLNNLSQNNLQNLLEDTLKTDTRAAEDTKYLTDLIYSKTLGNAFFTLRFIDNLYQEGLLKFDIEQSRWNCNIKKLKEIDITDNVVSLVLRQIKLLPDDVQTLLTYGACIGNEFDLGILTLISEKESQKLKDQLEIAIIHQLVFPKKEGGYKFTHDRIHQAAYELISDQDKEFLHLKIGRILLKQFNVLGSSNLIKASENHLFDITNHFNFSRDLIESKSEITDLAKLNLLAGQKAKASVAYSTARDYLSKAIDLLPDNSWNVYYDLSFSIYSEAVMCAYLSGKYDDIKKNGDIILSSVTRVQDKLVAYEYEILGLMAQSKVLEAVDRLLEIFNQFDLNIPADPTLSDVIKVSNELAHILKEKGKDILKKLPPTTDPKIDLILKLYLRSATAVFFKGPMMYSYAICKLLILSIKHGATPVLPYQITEYGFLNIFQENVKEGCELGSIALELLNKLSGYEPMKVRLKSFSSNYTYHWTENYSKISNQAMDLYQEAINCGDLDSASYSLIYYHVFQRCICTNIEIIEKKAKAHLSMIQESLNQPLAEGMISNFITFYQNLGKENTDLIPLERSAYFFADAPESVKPIFKLSSNLYYLISSFIFEKYYVPDFEQMLKDSPSHKGVAEYPDILFFTALSRLQFCDTTDRKEKAEHLKEVRRILKIMKSWSELGPMNFLHRYFLIKAELFKVLGKNQESANCYSKAIKLAKEHKFLYVEAIANELAAKFYMQNNSELAEFYFQKACHCYSKWGAVAKVRHLKENYPKYIHYSNQIESIGNDSLSSVGISGLLDVNTILKASQALSGEMRLDKLLEKMIQILIENAGAQKALYIENRGNNLLIQAEASVNRIANVLNELSVEGNELPLSIINYVKNSKEKLVFDNVSKNIDYSADSYIKEHQPKSLVCYPVLKQGELKGIIYLENNAVEGAFTPKRLEILNVLSSQLAISLENSRLYSDLRELNLSLEDKVEQRTHELSAAYTQLGSQHQELKQTQEQLVQSEKMASLGTLVAGVAHEINNPTNFVYVGIKNLENDLNEFKSFFFELLDDDEENREIREHFEEHFKRFSESLDTVDEGSERIKTIVTDLRAFSRLDEAEIKEVNIAGSIRSFLRLITTQYEEKINFSCQFDFEPKIECYPAQLNQVFMNVVNNSSRAILEKAETEENSLPGEILIRSFKSGDQLGISFKDTGCGMTKEVQNKIFEPFFTTREVGSGTGLGMSISYGIIEKHKGRIEVKSEPGIGSEVIIYIPLEGNYYKEAMKLRK